MIIIPFVNTIINPGNKEFKKYYLEDENYFTFNTQLGTTAYGHISEDIVQTDSSLMPY